MSFAVSPVGWYVTGILCGLRLRAPSRQGKEQAAWTCPGTKGFLSSIP